MIFICIPPLRETLPLTSSPQISYILHNEAGTTVLGGIIQFCRRSIARTPDPYISVRQLGTLSHIRVLEKISSIVHTVTVLLPACCSAIEAGFPSRGV